MDRCRLRRDPVVHRAKAVLLEIYFTCALANLFHFIYVDLSRAHRFQTINLLKDDLVQFICPFGIRAETNVDTILLARVLTSALTLTP